MAEAENKIQLRIIKKLLSHGIFCWRSGNHAVWDSKLNIYRSNPYNMPGLPDIVCIIGGQFVGIEVKTKKGKQSADQMMFEKRCKRNGGEYILATCIEDIDPLLKP